MLSEKVRIQEEARELEMHEPRYLVTRYTKEEANLFAEFPEAVKKTIREVHFAPELNQQGTYSVNLPDALADDVRNAKNLIDLVNLNDLSYGYSVPQPGFLNRLIDENPLSEVLEILGFGDARVGDVKPIRHKPGPVLDQGQQGACVGHGVRAFINGEPVFTDPAAGDDAFKIYRWCQANDGYDFKSGTTIEAGGKYLLKAGYVTKLGYTKSMDDFYNYLANVSGIVAGMDWFEGMARPDRNGYIRPTGKRTGGHCVWLNEILANLDIGGQNSWNERWGQNGFFKMSQADLRFLMARDHFTAFGAVTTGGPGFTPDPAKPPAEKVVMTRDLCKGSNAYKGQSFVLENNDGSKWSVKGLN